MSHRAALALALAVVTSLLLAVSACRSGSPSPPPGATRVLTSPIGSDTQGPTQVAALPTWTLPGPLPGGRPSAPAGPTAAPGAEPGPVPGALAGLPVPTVVPPPAADTGGVPAPDPEIAVLLGRVDGGKVLADVRRLEAFGTRHALSDPGSRTRGYRAAAEWVEGRLQTLAASSAAQMLVETEDFQLSASDLGAAPRALADQKNVLGTLTGIGMRKRVLYAVAHLDSRGHDLADGTVPAPGAEDNASGVASLLEAVRILSSRQWDATIRVMAAGAAEQGARGSAAHAGRARQVGLPVDAVLDCDGVGRPGEAGAADGVVYVADGNGPSAELARTVAVIASRYGLPEPAMPAAADRAGGTGDHLAFARAGFPAVRLTDSESDESALYGAGDTSAALDADALARRTRLAVAVLADLALAPPAPVQAPRAEPAGRPDALLVSWEAVPDAAVAGYWVGIRDESAAAYGTLRWVQGATQLQLEGLPAGRLRLAVAAGDALGHVGRFGPEAAVTTGG